MGFSTPETAKFYVEPDEDYPRYYTLKCALDHPDHKCLELFGSSMGSRKICPRPDSDQQFFNKIFMNASIRERFGSNFSQIRNGKPRVTVGTKRLQSLFPLGFQI
jgi:hypothetical protein